MCRGTTPLRWWKSTADRRSSDERRKHGLRLLQIRGNCSVTVRDSANYREFPELRIAIAQHIESLAEVLHAMEWSDSGDTSCKEWVQRAERYIGLMDLIQG